MLEKVTFEYCHAFFPYENAKCSKTEQDFRTCNILQTAPHIDPTSNWLMPIIIRQVCHRPRHQHLWLTAAILKTNNVPLGWEKGLSQIGRAHLSTPVTH